jgi:S1 RNA binding domain protein
VTKISEFGVFVKLEGNAEGFIHISDLSDSYIDSVEKYISVGQEFKAKMLGFDKGGKIKLTLKIEQNKSEKFQETDNIETPVKIVKERKKRFF